MEYMIELEGTPEEIKAMLSVASKVEPGIFRKRRINPGLCRLWYRGEQANNDLVAAIKRKAGLNKPKAKPAPKAEAADGDKEN